MAQVAIEQPAASSRSDRLRRVRDRVAGIPAAFGRLTGSLTVDRVLAVVAALSLPAGIMAIVLGWSGAAQTPFLFEQIPYLISGGLLGVGLLTAGGALYLGSWIVRSAHLAREREDAMRSVLEEVRDELRSANRRSPAALPSAVERTLPPVTAPVPAPSVPAASVTAEVPVVTAFVATPSGSMFHRADCHVVASRDDVIAVTPADGRTPCGMCEPLEA